MAQQRTTLDALRDQSNREDAVMRAQIREEKDFKKAQKKIKKAQRKSARSKARQAARDTGYDGIIIVLNERGENVPVPVRFEERPQIVVRNVQPARPRVDPYRRAPVTSQNLLPRKAPVGSYQLPPAGCSGPECYRISDAASASKLRRRR